MLTNLMLHKYAKLGYEIFDIKSIKHANAQVYLENVGRDKIAGINHGFKKWSLAHPKLEPTSSATVAAAKQRHPTQPLASCRCLESGNSLRIPDPPRVERLL